jgi:hypothetical protein
MVDLPVDHGKVAALEAGERSLAVQVPGMRG